MATVCDACESCGKYGYEDSPCRTCTRNPLHSDNFKRIRRWTKNDYELAKAFVHVCGDRTVFFERKSTRINSRGVEDHGDFLSWGTDEACMDVNCLHLPWKFFQSVKCGDKVFARDIIREYEIANEDAMEGRA